jgi:rhodanese-related sulfurtransferase
MGIDSSPGASSNSRDSGVIRGILVIVTAGIGLGLGFNFIQRASNHDNGLPWLRREVKLASLEEVVANSIAVSDSITNPGAVAAAPAPIPAPEDSPAPETAASAPAEGGESGEPPPPNDLPTVPDTDEPLEAQHETIMKFYESKAAVFVDARSAEEYAEGHIPGAINLSLDEVYENPGLLDEFEANGRPIICYCDGSDCDLSMTLAFSLIDAGHKKVLVYVGGTHTWQDAGETLEVGSTPRGSE